MRPLTPPSGSRKRYPDEEPSADIRQAASAVRQMFVALVQDGFTESQALVIVGHMIATGSR